ncbi:hypothetical protein SAMN05216360_12541 [Methylobacterium phyllostachyos]|uniref:Uncharacterized protein n=1 Tax=Methylobacterium phyllostachyos TaxID=582672 RepID=A0A1H0K898_9HYPH|nr:hypothetical protein [Methylobacterium phyllostachyos]SDO52195.1 hypothetical protein SAMN05216360_12541 [Methylobacterium phyllostachyos]
MLTTDDRLWFDDHPNRAYRNRAVPRAEAAFWRKPPAPNRYGWIITRRSDGAIRRYTLPAYAALDDTDAELGPIFAQLSDAARMERQTFPPSPGGALARIERSLSSLLTASEPYEPDAEPAVAYREEMRARGREALAIGGRETLDYLVDRLAGGAPGRAQVHAAILDVAWRGLTRARL